MHRSLPRLEWRQPSRAREIPGLTEGPARPAKLFAIDGLRRGRVAQTLCMAIDLLDSVLTSVCGGPTDTIDYRRNHQAPQLFDGIAAQYNWAPDLFSFFQYQRWRRYLVSRLQVIRA